MIIAHRCCEIAYKNLFKIYKINKLYNFYHF